MRCIAVAAKYHKVNHAVLSAILKVESSYNPGAVNRNADGSVDVGIGQMNSIHFKELATHGITPTDLMDPCVGSYVAAWHLGRQIQLHGNTWFAIGAYHSVTPHYNSRYQALVYNAMVDMRAVPGPKVVVVTPKTPYPP
jgi:soluble lytic murein transglycosylase-like protein